MNREQHEQKLEKFFGLEDDEPELVGNLDEAIYSLSELGLWYDDLDIKSREFVIQCWRVVEKLRTERFPDNLRM